MVQYLLNQIKTAEAKPFSNPYSTFCETALVQKLLPVSDWSNEERLLENYFKYFNETMEVFPFYCQCFLMVGMSFERWVIVCKPHSVKQILSRKNKIIYYSLISLCAVIVPSCVVGDYILNMRFVKFVKIGLETKKKIERWKS